MVGGPNSFASGRWNETSVGKMLPVELAAAGRDWDESATSLHAATEGAIHPDLAHLVRRRSEPLVAQDTAQLPGSNRVGRVKPGADVLARTIVARRAGEPIPGTGGPALRPGPHDGHDHRDHPPLGERIHTVVGRGADAPYYKKFWRNVIYWLTENSSVGRRRLLAETDKRLYRPGEPIVLRAHAFDENAAPTLDYRVAVTVEPRSASDVTADNSPLRRPTGGAKARHGQGPLLPWSEEFDLVPEHSRKDRTPRSLPIALAKSLPAGVTLTQGMRIELTAYENNTQVDSTTLEVQILDDPSEQQNPLPDHDLLRRIAEQVRRHGLERLEGSIGHDRCVSRG